MQTNIVAYYRKHDSFSRYLAANQPRVRELSRLYASNKRYFGNKVLDLACGGGVLGFIVERDGHTYTGVDVNPDMISAARSYSRKVGSRNRFITADITRIKIRGNFDTLCVLGNAMCHFSTAEFSGILDRTATSCRKGAHFIVDYRDMVRLMFDKEWNTGKSLLERDKGRISTTNGCDAETGFVHVTTADLHGENRVGFDHAIWSPFIITPIMSQHRWALVKRRSSKRWTGWLDVYRKT